MTGGECWLCWWRHEPTRWHDSKRDVCNLPSMSLFCKSRHTTMSKRLTEECEGFLKRFLSHVALGRFGPNCKLFFSTFSILLEYELYTLICLCKNTFILLSFEVWVTKIIHVLNVVLCIFYVLQHLSTWLWMRSDGERVTYWDMNCMKCSDVSQMYC